MSTSDVKAKDTGDCVEVNGRYVLKSVPLSTATLTLVEEPMLAAAMSDAFAKVTEAVFADAAQIFHPLPPVDPEADVHAMEVEVVTATPSGPNVSLYSLLAIVILSAVLLVEKATTSRVVLMVASMSQDSPAA